MAQARKCQRQACRKWFDPCAARRLFCSRDCANLHNALARRGRRYHLQTSREMPAHYGPAIIPPQAPPLCHGQALAFGSDPHTGVSVQYCATCGERPLQRFGKVEHSQRGDFEKELQAFIERASKRAKPSHGKAASSWQQDFQVVSKAMREKLER